jgi:hypothetical protein
LILKKGRAEMGHIERQLCKVSSANNALFGSSRVRSLRREVLET